MNENPIMVRSGRGRMVVSMPHVGHLLPVDVRREFSPLVRYLDDADWHVDRLYDFLEPMRASSIAASWSRWLVDLNRPPDDESLYPGQNTTGLCPVTSFSGVPLYRKGREPDAKEINRRRELYWQPYHDSLRGLINAAMSSHGQARVLDAHSIVSSCPRLFDGRLPDINIGTHGGRSCSAGLLDEVRALLEAQTAFSWVVDGRFRGGYITRHYGRPAHGVEAIQVELAQRTYMDEARPDTWDDARAEPLRALLKAIVTAIT